MAYLPIPPLSTHKTFWGTGISGGSLDLSLDLARVLNFKMADENELLAQLRRGVQTHNLDELLETLHGLKTWSKQLESRYV